MDENPYHKVIFETLSLSLKAAFLLTRTRSGPILPITNPNGQPMLPYVIGLFTQV